MNEKNLKRINKSFKGDKRVLLKDIRQTNEDRGLLKHQAQIYASIDCNWDLNSHNY